jgi:hypothetical protein
LILFSKTQQQLRAPSVYETSALTQEGYCEERENNYKPIGKMIVGKHEMSLRFINYSSYLYIRDVSKKRRPLEIKHIVKI